MPKKGEYVRFKNYERKIKSLFMMYTGIVYRIFILTLFFIISVCYLLSSVILLKKLHLHLSKTLLNLSLTHNWKQHVFVICSFCY